MDTFEDPTPDPSEQSQEELLAQIAALKAKLLPGNLAKVDGQPPPHSASKRSLSPPPTGARNPSVLVAASPSPKKRKLDPASSKAASHKKPVPSLLSSDRRPQQKKPAATSSSTPVPFTPRPSNAASIAASLYATQSTAAPQTIRSSSFAERPVVHEAEPAPSRAERPIRDDRGALIENLTRGPYDYDAPRGDPDFNTIEPHSMINLSSRKLPHEDMQELLRGRYYLSPSLLYSVIRIQPHKQGYDVPVEGDYVTIAVVAERGNVLVSRGGVSKQNNEDRVDGGEDGDDVAGSSKDAKKKPPNKYQKAKNTNPPPPSGKKYVNIKLVDFGHKSKTGSAKGSSSGDALLSLLLFEADSASYDQGDSGGGKTRGSAVYRGGSGGAFEEMLPMLKEGAVVAILNPRVLKPYQGRNATGSDKPHPTANILGITPSTADSIKIIGYSKDLGMCGAKKRDGKICGSWCDKRVAEVCEYHVMVAVKSVRSSRAEFAAGTGGMTTGPPTNGGRKPGTSGGKSSKPDYDPAQKWGLAPSTNKVRSDGTGATYIMSGSIVRTSDGLHVSQRKQKDERTKMREAKERGEKKDEELLKLLLRKDMGSHGAQALRRARDHLEKEKKKEAKADVVKGKGKGRAKVVDECAGEEEDEEESEKERLARLKKSAYGAEMSKRLGFDPTIKPGETRVRQSTGNIGNLATQPKRTFDLGPRPGPRIRSGVIVPEHLKAPPRKALEGEGSKSDEGDSDLEFDDGDIVMKMDRPTEPKAVEDDSDSELEIEPPL